MTKIFLQILGTAMGTPCAVVYSNLFMMWHHKNVLRIYHIIFHDNPIKLLIYKRFIDDLFLLFKTSLEAYRFIFCFNLVIPTIQIANPQYSHEHNNSVNFVDVCIYVTEQNFIGENTTYVLNTQLYRKPCFKPVYLPPVSMHQPHIFPNWVKGEILRTRIMCSEDI
jgi:hypothetical protein